MPAPPVPLGRRALLFAALSPLVGADARRHRPPLLPPRLPACDDATSTVARLAARLDEIPALADRDARD